MTRTINKLSVDVIIKIYEHLRKICAAKKFVSLEDLYNCLSFVAGGSLEPEALKAHANLMLRCAFYPCLSESDHCRLIMRDSLRESPEQFLLSLNVAVDEIESRPGKDSDVEQIKQLKRDIFRNALIFVDEPNRFHSKRVDEVSKQSLYSSVAAAAAGKAVVNPSPAGTTKAPLTSSAATAPPSHPQKEDSRRKQKVGDVSKIDPRASSSNDGTKKAPISGNPLMSTKFRAHGSEILECDLMDPILCCIYLVMTLDNKGFEQLYPNRPERTHRCVVDSITHVAELCLFGDDFNNMSKTKIRSVTGILKSCGALIPTTLGDEICPCLLILSKNLNSFLECRAAVDTYMNEDETVVAQPPSKKDKYMWTERTKEARRDEAMDILTKVRAPIKAFLSTFVEPPIISPTKQMTSLKEKVLAEEREVWSRGAYAATHQGTADIDFLAALETMVAGKFDQPEPILCVDTTRPPPGFAGGEGPSSVSPTTTDETGNSPLGEEDFHAAKVSSAFPTYSLWGSHTVAADKDGDAVADAEEKAVTATVTASSIFGNHLITGLP